MSVNNKLLIIGNSGETQVGVHFLNAAHKLNLQVYFADQREAFSGAFVLQRINWWLLGHRPSHMMRFSRKVLSLCQSIQPAWILCTGRSPLDAEILNRIGNLGIYRVNYLTDDPWNPSHKASWLFKSLSCYDAIFSTRKSNLCDLQKLGCKRVHFLPFAYSPEVHYPECPGSVTDRLHYACDVAFIGAADEDRLSYMKAFIYSGIKIHLYGNRWNRYPDFSRFSRGYANPQDLRWALSSAKVAIGLVRRANRDDNSMRTFEIPAIGACMLAEDTDVHRSLFGQEGENVLYFKECNEMLEKTRYLLDNDTERMRLANAAHNIIIQGKHTYEDRLSNILEKVNCG